MNDKQLYADGAQPHRLPVLCRLFSATVEAVASLAMAVSAGCVLVALALIGYSVVVRYFLGQPSLWIDEVVSFLVVAIVMFGVASALREGRHIGVDLLTERLGSRGQRVAKAWSMLTVLSLSMFLVFNGWETAAFSREIGQVSQGHLELPMFWLQLMIPFGGLMLALTALDALLQLACGAPAEGGEH